MTLDTVKADTRVVTGIFGSTFDRGWDTGLPTDRSWLEAFVEVETALVRAGLHSGAIPATAGRTILDCWGAADIEVHDVGEQAAAGGNPIIALATALKALVPQNVREYVHLGATSQDILDTALMVLARRAVIVIIGHLNAAADEAAALTAEHADTRMAGRTLMQDALPITFGLKSAAWMSGLDGAAVRLRSVVDTLPVQYGGPVGTFSGAPGHGSAIRRQLAALLDLVEPTLAWHTIRLPIADLAGALGTAAGIVAKVALDVVLMAQTAVSELQEGQPEDETAPRGGSSSMPHKHNPIAAISARACAMRTPGLVGTLYSAMAQEHERAAGPWHSEWETLTDLLRLTGSAAAWLTDSLRHLAVDPAAMALAVNDMPTTPDASGELVAEALRTRPARQLRTAPHHQRSPQ